MLCGAWTFGSRWFARADPFEVYSMAVSRLSPFRRNPATGAIVVGSPLDLPPLHRARAAAPAIAAGAPGVVAVLSVLFGSTVFDSYAASPSWRSFADRLSASAEAVPAHVSSSVLRTIGLAVFIAVVAATFTLAAGYTEPATSRR